jgi:hypothetical protein
MPSGPLDDIVDGPELVRTILERRSHQSERYFFPVDPKKVGQDVFYIKATAAGGTVHRYERTPYFLKKFNLEKCLELCTEGHWMEVDVSVLRPFIERRRATYLENKKPPRKSIPATSSGDAW